MLEVKFDTLEYNFTAIEKKIKIERTPQAPFSHIMQEEVYASIDAVDFATDFGNKFISPHQVVLGGFEKAVQELIQIQDLVISAKGSSRLASLYGEYMMRDLEIFNSVSVFDPSEINPLMLSDLRYGGFMSVTQSGSGKAAIDALKLAYAKNLTCFNVVNTESSPITKAIDEVQKENVSKVDEK